MRTCVITAHGMGCKREEVDPGELLAQIVETHALSQNTHTHTPANILRIKDIAFPKKLTQRYVSEG